MNAVQNSQHVHAQHAECRALLHMWCSTVQLDTLLLEIVRIAAQPCAVDASCAIQMSVLVPPSLLSHRHLHWLIPI